MNPNLFCFNCDRFRTLSSQLIPSKTGRRFCEQVRPSTVREKGNSYGPGFFQSWMVIKEGHRFCWMFFMQLSCGDSIWFYNSICTLRCFWSLNRSTSYRTTWQPLPCPELRSCPRLNWKLFQSFSRMEAVQVAQKKDGFPQGGVSLQSLPVVFGPSRFRLDSREARGSNNLGRQIFRMITLITYDQFNQVSPAIICSIAKAGQSMNLETQFSHLIAIHHWIMLMHISMRCIYVCVCLHIYICNIMFPEFPHLSKRT